MQESGESNNAPQDIPITTAPPPQQTPPQWSNTPTSSTSMDALNLYMDHPFGSAPSELCWTTGLDSKSMEGCGFSEFIDMDVSGLDSMSFTQCLQSGLQMDNSDYNAALTRSFREGFGGEAAHSSRDVFEFQSPTIESQGADPPTVPATPVSSMSSSSTEAGEDPPAATPASSSVPDQDSLDKPQSDNKKTRTNKPRKKGQKRNREPRFAFMTKSDVDHLEDGYRWRKYGQKAVKNSPYPRSYYRCTNTKCSVKKRVERSFEDPSIVITTYEGQHTHQSPALLRSAAGSSAAGALMEETAALHALGNSSFTNNPGLLPPPLNYRLHMMAQRSNVMDPEFKLISPQQQMNTSSVPTSQQLQLQQHAHPHPALVQQRAAMQQQPQMQSQSHVNSQLVQQQMQNRSHVNSQLVQQQNQQALGNDHGLLEDIVPSVMRKIS